LRRRNVLLRALNGDIHPANRNCFAIDRRSSKESPSVRGDKPDGGEAPFELQHRFGGAFVVLGNHVNPTRHVGDFELLPN
jgi:hypothetical protein